MIHQEALISKNMHQEINFVLKDAVKVTTLTMSGHSIHVVAHRYMKKWEVSIKPCFLTPKLDSSLAKRF